MNSNIIQIILQSGKFPHVFNQRKLIETHISYIILGSSFAYKFKKDIHFSFLDFSTLEKRKFYCERELMLNNRLTQGMYLEVIPVRSEKGEIIIDGKSGEIIDYALKMKRMRDSRQMHIMLSKNQVHANHISILAGVIRKFHDQAEVIKRDFDSTRFSARFNDILSITEIINAHLGAAYSKTIYEATIISEAFLAKYRDLFIQRIENNFIRDCHGDLHSGNIFLYAKPVIFDCIEFNDEMRQIDILDEIAFFCMDLEAQGFEGFSRTFLNHYFKKSNEEFDNAAQLLFSYYKFYRANVRAKVIALRIKSGAGDISEKNITEAETYLALMKKYMTALN